MAGLLSCSIAGEVMKAKNESSRPKQAPADTTDIPAAAPAAIPAKRAQWRVSGHPAHDSTEAARAHPYVGDRRVMILDRIHVSVVLEDPFYDHGRYPIEIALPEFLGGWWAQPAAPEHVRSEYERIGIKPPEDIADRFTNAEGLRTVYVAMLRAAAEQIEAQIDAAENGHAFSCPVP
jgi:hypothetical protein